MKTTAIIGASLSCALATTSSAFAQGWPVKPIRLVVPTTAASPIDIVSRWIVDGMTKEIGQPIVVENRPGGLALIGLQDALRSPADGYTMAVISMPMTLNPSIAPNYSVDLRTAFQPVGRTVFSYNVLVVHPSVPATTMAELVGVLKAAPGKRSFLSGGTGTPAHVVGELFKLETSVSALHVPYVQFAQGIGNLIGGELDFGFIATPPMIPHVRAGRLRPLAVTAPKRLPALSEVPTVAEAGFPGLQVSDWGAFLVKSGTPTPVVERLNAALVKVLSSPEAPEALAKFGAEPAPTSPAEAARFIASELERWAKVAKAASIKLE